MKFRVSEVLGSIKDNSRQSNRSNSEDIQRNQNLSSHQNNNQNNFQRNQRSQRVTRSMLINFSQSQQQLYEQPVPQDELKKFEKNFLRNIYVLTRDYILKNSQAQKMQKKWIRSNPHPSDSNMSQQQVLSEFYAWVKRLNVRSAKKIRQNLGNQGKRYNKIQTYFQQFYKTEALRFYTQDVQIYIINHKFASNKSKKYRNQADQNQQRKKYLKIIWKMVWMIKNVTKFNSLASIRY